MTGNEETARHRALELFLAASRLAEEERDDYLRRECTDDDTLLKRVRELLALDAGSVTADGGGKAPEATGRELLERLTKHRPSELRYEDVGEIARGGMGAIHMVWDPDLRRTLAMKVLLGRPPSGEQPTPVDDPSLGRFLEEAQVTGQLDHPGIVPVYELGVDDKGEVFFTMRLVRGRELKEVIGLVHKGEEGWNLTRALGVLLKVCEAMAYAHSKGVVHRDLKPSNVMVGRFGEVYVMDWGLARVLGREDTKDIRLRPEEPETMSVRSDRSEDETPGSPLCTMDGDIVGTPAYMPPEQALGKVSEVGPRSDVYAVGAMLYHLLGGEVPYVPPGSRLRPALVLMQLLQGPPKPLREIQPKVHAELEAICERAMARQPDLRYEDVQQLRSDLAAHLEGRNVRAYNPRGWERLRAGWARQSRKTRWGVSLICTAVLLICISVAIVLPWASGDESRLPFMLLAVNLPCLPGWIGTMLLVAAVLDRSRPRKLATIFLAPIGVVFVVSLICTPLMLILLRAKPNKDAQVAFDQGLYQRAIEVLDGVPASEWNDEDRMVLAKSYRKIGSLDRALEVLASSEEPTLEIERLHALLLIEAGRAEEAAEMLEQER
jgi:serine/threonine protein kinase